MANIENTVTGIINTGNNSTYNVNNVIVTSSAPQQNPMKNLDFGTMKPVESFRGREQELEQLSVWLSAEDQRLAVVSGLPGYGKTELVRRFAQSCREEARVRSVLWLDADSPEVLEQSFRELLRWLGAGVEADLGLRPMVQAVRRHFSAQHLFVFDNAPDRRSVAGFLPEGACRCLCTSHVQDWGDGVPVLPLEPLPMDAALDVFRTVLGQRFLEADAPLYRRLADLLSRVPLALQVAAAFVRQEMLDLRQEFSLSSYVEEFQKSFNSYLDTDVPGFSDMPYENTIYEAFKKALRKIEGKKDDIAKLSIPILHILAYLNLNHISLSDLQKFSYITKLSDNRKFKKALSFIQNFSFIRIIDKKNKIIIHKLVQKVIIFYQSITAENHNPYYIFCLEYVSCVYPSIHSYSILEVIDNHMASFEMFCKDNETNITSTNAFLHNLIKSGCLNILNKILTTMGRRAAAIINARCLLHCAVLCQQHDVLKHLLTRGALVEQRDELKNTAFLLTDRNLDLAALKILTSHKADINAVDKQGDNIMHRIVYATGFPQNVDKVEVALEALRWLVGRGARIDAGGHKDRTLLHIAAFALSPQIVPHLVHEFGLDVNAVTSSNETPLHYLSSGMSSADRERRIRTAECLLQLGARLDVVDNYGRTPADEARRCGLDYLAGYFENPTENIYSCVPQALEFTNALRAAVAVGDVETLSQQLDELEDRAVEVASSCGLLHYAVAREQHEALELLLERGADVASRNDHHETALNIAALNLDKQSMEQLIRHGADVNAVDVTEKSILHCLMLGAGSQQDIRREDEVCEMLRWLVGRGARANAVTAAGETLLHLAACSLKVDLVRCLLTEFHLDVHAEDKYLRTALYYVIGGLDLHQKPEYLGIATATCLLDFGARTDLLNMWGKSPSQRARQSGYEKLAAFLDQSANGDTNQMVEDTDIGSEGAAVSAAEILPTHLDSSAEAENNQQTEDTDRGDVGAVASIPSRKRRGPPVNLDGSSSNELND